MMTESVEMRGYDDYPGRRTSRDPEQGYDESSEGDMGDQQFSESFELVSVRRQFIKKVYGVVAAMLAIVTLITAVFIFGLRDTVRENKMAWTIVSLLCFIPVLAIVIAISCCTERVGRRFPLNILLLTIMAVLYGFIVGILSTAYTVESVLIALGITVVTVLLVTAFAFCTKIDFTACMGWIFMLCVLLMVFGLVFVIVSWSGVITNGADRYALKMVYGGLGAFVMCICLVLDTQLMMIGKHKYSYNPDDWAYAALSIFQDIITLFLYILMLVGAVDSD